jgi:geranylgeranyl pyrophosphate synthase
VNPDSYLARHASSAGPLATSDAACHEASARQLDEFVALVRGEMDLHLEEAFASCPSGKALDVARYASLGEAGRSRPLFMVAAGSILSPRALEACGPLAAAFELVHCASLILDDLPSMDDGRLRRGRPCAHLVFERWAVDLAPVLMMNLAFRLILEAPNLSLERRVSVARVLSSTVLSMILGQQLDLTRHLVDARADAIEEAHRHKTGSLFAGAVDAGALACGATPSQRAPLGDAASEFGIAFQVLDDISDMTETVETLGKDVGKDAGRVTAVSVDGLAGARARLRVHRDRALLALRPFGDRAGMLRALIRRALRVE